jgi:lauroyl/myristoyl acyltransferase
LAGQALSAHLPGIQVFTLPNPGLGFQLANALRRQSGACVTPLSTGALRQAMELLLKQGVVAMACDRPVSEMDKTTQFFGRPARVPTGPVRLALRANARIVVVYCIVDPVTQRDTLHLETPLDLIRTGNRDEEITINTRRVLDVVEPIIRRGLDQWLMFVPVWPE